MMKKIYIFLLIVISISCNETEDIFEENFVRGGFAQFTQDLEINRFNLLNFEDVVFSAQIIDPNNNITSYALTLVYGDITVDNFIVLNSLPGTIEFTGPEILNALNLTVDDLDVAIPLQFVATITTPNGIFVGQTPAFDSGTNTSTGGDTASEVFASAVRQAVNFSFTLFIPPPKKIRGTSFEEPFAAPSDGDDYIRPDGQDVNFSGQLFNIDGLRHIAHTANGTGVDDEIGFTAEFTEDGQSGFSNEEIGVTRKTSVVGSYIDGIQGYQIEDVDGIWTLTFDKVVIPDEITTSGVRVQTFPIIRDYGSNDFINIYVLVEKRDGTSETIELLNVNGDDMSALGGRWNLVDSGFLEGIASYTLVIETEINSGSEEVYYDEVLIYQPGE